MSPVSLSIAVCCSICIPEMESKVPTPTSHKVRDDEFIAMGEAEFGSPGFRGFENGNTALHRRVLNIERKLDELIRDRKLVREEETQDKEFHRNLKERVRKLEDNASALKEENTKLKNEVEKYKKLLNEGLGKVEKEKEDMNAWREEQITVWKEQQDNDKKAFREVMQEQIKEKEEIIQKKMIGVLKSKETLIREIAEKKKSVIVFGAKENNITYKPKREKVELKMVKDLLKHLNDEDRQNLEDDVEEIHRMGPYKKEGTRPIKVLFKSQQTTEEVLYRTTKLREVEGCKDIYIKKNRNEDERKRHSELVSQAEVLNNERSETEKNTFFWKVLGDRVRKWYIKKREEEETEGAVGGRD